MHHNAGDADPRSNNGVTLLKLFMRTDGAADGPRRPTAGTDVGMEIWLPDPEVWNKRVRVQIQGGFMGDPKVTASDAFSDTPCGAEMSMAQVAAERGYVVATTDGGHQASTYEDMSYLMNSDGSINDTGWKNIAWQATRLTRQITNDLAVAYYQQSPSHFYLFGCSTGGRQAYHIAQRYPEDFDGYLVSCPSITQSLLFPSLIHPHIVIQNDLKGQHFRPGQLEMVSRQALSAGDTFVTGSHDGYITRWDCNTYDPTKDETILSLKDGGTCVAPWALSVEQAHAINKIWYGPTLDGSCPDPAQDNGASYQLAPRQLWWGKLRGTRIDFSDYPRHVSGGMLAVAHRDVSLASPLWDHPLGRGRNRWRDFTYTDFAEAMIKCQSMDAQFGNMDADNPDLSEAQRLGKKILAYHGLADTGVAPQSTVRYYEASTVISGGLSATQMFHRLFLVPGMGHCVRYRGSAGTIDPPTPAMEDIFDSLVAWVERGRAPDRLQATSSDGKRSRGIALYPKLPTYCGGDKDSHDSFSY